MLLRFNESLVELPSQGKAYDLNKIPLINGNSVVIKPYLMGEQRDIEPTFASRNVHKIFQTIVARLLVTPDNIDYDELLMSDIMALSYAVKVKTWGQEFTLPMTCVNCKRSQIAKITMDKFEVKYAEEFENYEVNNIPIVLNEKHTIVCHVLRLRDEKNVIDGLEKLKKLKKDKDVDLDTRLLRIASMIDEIDGKKVTDIIAKFEALLTLTGDKIDEIEFEIDSHDGGMVLDAVPVICENAKCKFNNAPYVNLGMSPTFFRGPIPTVQGNAGGNASETGEVLSLDLSGHSLNDPERVAGSTRPVPQSLRE